MSSNPLTTVPPKVTTGDVAVDPTVPDLEPADSVPIQISEYLGQVARAVCADVGPDVCGPVRYVGDGTPAVTIVITGTDETAIAASVQRHVAPDVADRVTVAGSDYSTNELQAFAEKAQSILDDAGISATVWLGDPDTVEVRVCTDDGQPDERLRRELDALLSAIPHVTTFSQPLTLTVESDDAEPTC